MIDGRCLLIPRHVHLGKTRYPPACLAMIRSSYRQLLWPILTGALMVSAYVGSEVVSSHLATLEVPQGVASLAAALLTTAGVFAAAWLASRTVQFLVTALMLRKGRRPSRLLLQLINIVFFAIAAGAAMSLAFDGALAGALATSGILVAIIGFALRNVIADVFSGIALSLETPYQIGDWIETDTGITGRVVEINWRATRIETRNQVHIVVPNGRMAVGRLTNYSAPRPYFRTNVSVTLDFEVPVSRAKRILLAAVSATENIRPTPAPDVKVEGHAERGIKYSVRYWVPSFAEDVDCRDAVLANIDRHLRLAGLSVPTRDRVLLERPRRPAAQSASAHLEMLTHLPAFRELPPDALAQLLPAVSAQTIAGDTLVLDGARPDDQVHVLVEGLWVLLDDADRELIKLEPGTMVGQPSRLVIPPSAAAFRVFAATDCLMLSIATSRLKTSVLENTPVGDALRGGLRDWQAVLDSYRNNGPVTDAAKLADAPLRSGSVLIRLRDWMK